MFVTWIGISLPGWGWGVGSLVGREREGGVPHLLSTRERWGSLNV